MRLTSKVEVHTRSKEVLAQMDGFAEAFTLEIAKLAQAYAQRNVAPGQGPGPHPHKLGSNHIDEGDLMRSIQVAAVPQGFLHTAHLFTDLDYGPHLEFGWTTSAGTHWRYPWMYPAVMEARMYHEKIARSTSRRFISKAGSARMERVNINAPLSATLVPESAP